MRVKILKPILGYGYEPGTETADLRPDEVARLIESGHVAPVEGTATRKGTVTQKATATPNGERATTIR